MNHKDRVANIITEEIKKSEILDAIRKDKEYERTVKKIVREVIKDMFRVLWQHNSIFNTLSN